MRANPRTLEPGTCGHVPQLALAWRLARESRSARFGAALWAAERGTLPTAAELADRVGCTERAARRVLAEPWADLVDLPPSLRVVRQVDQVPPTVEPAPRPELDQAPQFPSIPLIDGAQFPEPEVEPEPPSEAELADLPPEYRDGDRGPDLRSLALRWRVGPWIVAVPDSELHSPFVGILRTELSGAWSVVRRPPPPRNPPLPRVSDSDLRSGPTAAPQAPGVPSGEGDGGGGSGPSGPDELAWMAQQLADAAAGACDDDDKRKPATGAKWLRMLRSVSDAVNRSAGRPDDPGLGDAVAWSYGRAVIGQASRSGFVWLRVARRAPSKLLTAGAFKSLGKGWGVRHRDRIPRGLAAALLATPAPVVPKGIR